MTVNDISQEVYSALKTEISDEEITGLYNKAWDSLIKDDINE